MSKKPASLTSDLLARKGEAEPSTIDPGARMTLPAGASFSSYGDDGRDDGGDGHDDDDNGRSRPRPPEPEIIYTAEETGSGGGGTRLIVGALLGLLVVGGLLWTLSSKSERGVAPVSTDIVAEAPTQPAVPQTAPPASSEIPPVAASPVVPGTMPATGEAAPHAPGSEALTPSPADHGAVVPGAPGAPETIPGTGNSEAGVGVQTSPVEPLATQNVPTAPVAQPAAPKAAVAEKPASPKPATAQASSKGAYVVQLLALKDEAAARKSWAQLMKRHPKVLAGHALDVEKAELGPKGTWYRVRAAGFTTRATAASACTQLKAAGQDCIPKKR